MVMGKVIHRSETINSHEHNHQETQKHLIVSAKKSAKHNVESNPESKRQEGYCLLDVGWLIRKRLRLDGGGNTTTTTCSVIT